MSTKGIFCSLSTWEEARKSLLEGKQVFVFDNWIVYSCNEGMIDAFESYGFGPTGQCKDEDHKMEFCVLLEWFSNGQQITLPKGKFRIFSSYVIPGTDDYEPWGNSERLNSNEREWWVTLERFEKHLQKMKAEGAK